MTKSLNRDRFAKVLALAESPSDGEALAAIRKAAAMARAAGLSLGEALNGTENYNVDEWASGYQAGRQAGFNDGVKVGRTMASPEPKATKRTAKAKAAYDDGVKAGKEEGFRAGYLQGLEEERQATDRAYCRGFADGKAAVDLYATKRGKGNPKKS